MNSNVLRRGYVFAILLGLLSVVSVPAFGADSLTSNPDAYGKKCKADWLYRGQVGLSTHYFAVNPEDRVRMANAFDITKVAHQAADAGASWFLLTVHHQSWVMMAPNETYDRLMGNGEYTAERDLPMELSNEFEHKGIRLMLYVNLRLDPDSICPDSVRQAMGGWPPNDTLINNIAAVYREFSIRYGKRVSGWWVDAAGIPGYAKAPSRDDWFKTIANALRAGNPDALVSFNPGLRIIRYSREDDYTAGESNNLSPQPTSRWLDGIQWHEWTYLGGWWASNGTRFDDEALGEYISRVTKSGGALTFEVGTRGILKSDITSKAVPNGHIGYIDPVQVEQLRRLTRYRRVKSLDSSECVLNREQ